MMMLHRQMRCLCAAIVFVAVLTFGSYRFLSSPASAALLMTPLPAPAAAALADLPEAWMPLLEGGFHESLDVAPSDMLPAVAPARQVLEASRAFQRFIRAAQFPGKSCGKLYVLRQHSFGLFSQVQGMAHSLLEALAHGYVFTWANATTRYADKGRCASQSFECFFLPITSCASAPVRITRRNSCAFDRAAPDRRNAPDAWDNSLRVDVVVRLRRLAGLAGDALGAHFFLREALRFLMRPNPELRRLVRELAQNQLKPLPGWKPLGACGTCRVGMHVRRGDKSKDWFVPPLSWYTEQLFMRAAVESSAGVEQVVFGSDDASAYHEVQAALGQSRNQNDADRAARQRNATRVAHIPLNLFSTTATMRPWHAGSGEAGLVFDDGMLLIAQAFVFASCDMFLGVFSSNVGTTVHALMGALRNTANVPAYDVTGSPWAACSIFSPFPYHPSKLLLPAPPPQSPDGAAAR
jgi:hypothetical protein